MNKSKRNRVISDLYSIGIPQKVWRYEDKETLNDFIQYCYLLLLEMDEEYLFKLAEEGTLPNYFYVICKRQSQPNSAFWREHGCKIDEVTLDDTKELEDTSYDTNYN